MAVIRVELLLELDEEILADHDQDKEPPPHDIDDWIASDIEFAIKHGIVDLGESEIVSIEDEPGGEAV